MLKDLKENIQESLEEDLYIINDNHDEDLYKNNDGNED